MMFEATYKGQAKMAFQANSIVELPPKSGFFRSSDGKVRIHFTQGSFWSGVTEMDGNCYVDLKTTYNDLMQHAISAKAKHPLGLINIDKFSPSFSMD